VFFFFGKRVWQLSALSLLFLFFMVPLPYIIYDAVSFPLKLFVTKTSVGALKLMGLPVLREGNIIMFPELTLEVADACSGLRSLVSLLALGVAAAFVVELKGWQRVLVVISAVPIAIFTNWVRVVVTGVLSNRYGAEAASGFFHEFAGFTVFIVALALLGALTFLLKKFSR